MVHEEEVTFTGLFVPFTTFKAVIIIAIFGLLVFSFGLFNGFVGDDNTQILNNPAIHSLSNIPAFFLEDRLSLGIAKLGGGYFKPFLDTSFATVFALSGSNAFGYHLFQVLLSIANAIIIFFFFSKFFKKEISFIVALLFLLHPINSEAALYISATQEVLFLFFGMVALLLVSTYTSQKALILASICLLLSLLSKETGVLFLLVAIAYTGLFRRKNFFPILLSSVIVFVLYLFLRIHAIGLGAHGIINAPIERLSLFERLINSPMIFWFYIKTFLFPLILSSSWQWVYTRVDFAHFFVPLFLDILILGGLGWVGLLIYKRQSNFSLYLFFVGWLVLGICFHLQILPLDQTVAERWFYFPMVGAVGIIGILLEGFHIQFRNALLLTSIVLILVVLSMRTFVRSLDYSNDFTLASRDSGVVRDSYNLEYIMSHEYYMQGILPEALTHAKRSVALFPYITNYTNLGAIYSSMGDYKHAKENYLKALSYGEDSLPYENLAMLSLVWGDKKENISFMKNALKKYPKDGTIWTALTEVAYMDEDTGTAKSALLEAKKYSRDPNLPLIEYIMTNNKPLKIAIQNGGIVFYTVK